jgi:phage terminase small subunit
MRHDQGSRSQESIAPKLTPKQKRFVEAYIVTGNASEAYRQAYDTSKMSEKVIGNEASKLLQHHGITMELDRSQQEHAKRHNVTIDTITAMLKEDRALARKMEQPAAAVSAAMGLAKLHGLIVDKGSFDHRHSAQDEAVRELEEIYRQANGKPH